MKNKKTENIREMQSLLRELRPAARAYYQEGRELMSNRDYDEKYDRLRRLEKESGVILSGSLTQQVGYEVLSSLPKERHPSPMLSLDKTKDREVLRDFLGEEEGLLSWKLDGLTVVLRYEGGELQKAVTRGNGEIGEVITQNVRNFENVPIRIPFSGSLLLRGEAVISYADFERINQEIPETDARYKNPRNLCSGSVRQLDPEITGKRHVNLIAFALVSAEEKGVPVDFHDSHEEEFIFLEQQGFTVVEYRRVNKNTIFQEIEAFSKRISENAFPSDGLVLLYNNVSYGLSLGRTAKFPRNAMAFKWSDEVANTRLLEVEWSASRTGLLNPVAIFMPVELEGTTVRRASLHNLSCCEELQLGIGDEITVYKANMIIPQIAENLTRSGTLKAPERCPACQSPTRIRQEKEAKTVYCENQDCPAKRIKNFSLFVSRDALNIDGLSEMTLEKLLSLGMVSDFSDLFHLERHRERLITMEGFGEKSYQNLLQSVEKSRETTVARLLYGLGIPGIGVANARMLSRHFHASLEALEQAELSDFLSCDGIGEVLAESLYHAFRGEALREELFKLRSELHFTDELTEEELSGEKPLSGKTVVITGSLAHFKNRRELEERIETAGGKSAGSVSKNTSYLVNNDIASDSAKNRKAKSLSVPIVTEEEFIKILEGEL